MITSAYPFVENEIEDMEITSGELVNRVTINYAWDIMDEMPNSSITKENPLSILLYGVQEKTFDLRMIQRTRQADILADAVLKTSSLPPLSVAFRHSNQRSVLVEVGDEATITHRAGIGANGFEAAAGIITKKSGDKAFRYEIALLPSGELFQSKLVSLCEAAGHGGLGYRIEYSSSGVTITVYHDISGNPPVSGAEVVLNGQLKYTTSLGTASFVLTDPGDYTAKIKSAGYDDVEASFTFTG